MNSGKYKHLKDSRGKLNLAFSRGFMKNVVDFCCRPQAGDQWFRSFLDEESETQKTPLMDQYV